MEKARRTRADPPFGADVASMPLRTWLADIWMFGPAMSKGGLRGMSVAMRNLAIDTGTRQV
jgi:hypothetical protein